jgi:hypothetical protein
VADADVAMTLSTAYVKAYFRKATALVSIGDEFGAYNCWKESAKMCELTPWLKKQIKDSLDRWKLFFNKVPIVSSSDLLERYKFAGKNTRLKLSTLAHFWNFSTKAERLEYLSNFLELIGGNGAISDGKINLLWLLSVN